MLCDLVSTVLFSVACILCDLVSTVHVLFDLHTICDGLRIFLFYFIYLFFIFIFFAVNTVYYRLLRVATYHLPREVAVGQTIKLAIQKMT